MTAVVGELTVDQSRLLAKLLNAYAISGIMPRTRQAIISDIVNTGQLPQTGTWAHRLLDDAASEMGVDLSVW